jgi:hypothetical protein
VYGNHDGLVHLVADDLACEYPLRPLRRLFHAPLLLLGSDSELVLVNHGVQPGYIASENAFADGIVDMSDDKIEPQIPVLLL